MIVFLYFCLHDISSLSISTLAFVLYGGLLLTYNISLFCNFIFRLCLSSLILWGLYSFNLIDIPINYFSFEFLLYFLAFAVNITRGVTKLIIRSWVYHFFDLGGGGFLSLPIKIFKFGLVSLLLSLSFCIFIFLFWYFFTIMFYSLYLCLSASLFFILFFVKKKGVWLFYLLTSFIFPQQILHLNFVLRFVLPYFYTFLVFFIIHLYLK